MSWLLSKIICVKLTWENVSLFQHNYDVMNKTLLEMVNITVFWEITPRVRVVHRCLLSLFFYAEDGGTRSSETRANFHHAIRCYTSESSNLPSYRKWESQNVLCYRRKFRESLVRKKGGWVCSMIWRGRQKMYGKFLAGKPERKFLAYMG
jgi:hypothetical protein